MLIYNGIQKNPDFHTSLLCIQLSSYCSFVVSMASNSQASCAKFSSARLTSVYPYVQQNRILSYVAGCSFHSLTLCLLSHLMLEMKSTAYIHIICPCLYFHTHFILITVLYLSHNNIGVGNLLLCLYLLMYMFYFISFCQMLFVVS